MAIDAPFSREFFVLDEKGRTRTQLTISAPETVEELHFCRVSLVPLQRREARVHGADQAQAAELAREFVVRLLSDKRVSFDGVEGDFDAERLFKDE